MHQYYDMPRLHLQSGATIENARLSVACHGSLNEQRDNAVLIFTPFGTTQDKCAYLFGSGQAIDPSRHFVVVFDTFGNGEALSPSNCRPPLVSHEFPEISIYDNVIAQHHFVVDRLRIKRIALAVGHSMGALQAYQWAALFPDLVERIAPICGAARTSVHNVLFLNGIQDVITSDPAWKGGRYENPPEQGLRRAARIWSAWAPSPGFYREEGYRLLGFESLEDYLVGLWETNFLRRDANDILCQIGCWQRADLSRNSFYNGDFKAALSAISAKAFVLPGATDPYFPPEDSAEEVRHMRAARLLPIPSPWGHWAGNGRRKEDRMFVEAALDALLKL